MNIKNILALLLMIAGGQLFAQNIAGTYTMRLDGNQIYTDRTPVLENVNGTTTFTITQTGDEITVTMSGFQSEWSAHIMKGRVGNNRFVAALSNGDRSIYMIQGTVNGGQLEGEYVYVRHGNASSGIVPGWTHVNYQAKK
ncbi:MAG: hypothetical protein OHK0039_37590 [Bacteroidia bacterium]